MECDRSLNLMIPACNWTLAVLSPVLSPAINSFRLTAFSWQSKFITVMEKDEHPSLQAYQSTRPTPELRQWTLQIYPMTHNATRSPPFMRTRILVRRISRDPFHFLPPLSTLWYVTHHLDTWVFRMCCRNNESIMQCVSDSIEHLLWRYLASIHMHSWTWIYCQLSYFMQSYNDIVVALKCHIVWSVLLLEVMCCTIPIVLKWPFRAACMWLRQQEADQERKSAIACLLLSGMFLSATEVSTKEWWRKRWLLEIECF